MLQSPLTGDFLILEVREARQREQHMATQGEAEAKLARQTGRVSTGACTIGIWAG